MPTLQSRIRESTLTRSRLQEQPLKIQWRDLDAFDAYALGLVMNALRVQRQRSALYKRKAHRELTEVGGCPQMVLIL